ncbi:MAG: AbrB/MazE/SpoVT family DNA-binding domain-containing protein [Verrucomicrobiales bacterium]
MKSTLTSKGQLTVPARIRKLLHLKPGDVLEFDETAPFLKATKAIAPGAWQELGTDWEDPFPDCKVEEALKQLRGPVEHPPGHSQP